MYRKMAETFCTSGAVKLKAGSGAATLTGAQYTELINQAESFINCVCRHNFIDTYSGLNSDLKMILEETASNLAAIYNIQYSMAGFTTRIEAEDQLNILWARFVMNIALLKDQKTVDFINEV